MRFVPWLLVLALLGLFLSPALAQEQNLSEEEIVAELTAMANAIAYYDEGSKSIKLREGVDLGGMEQSLLLYLPQFFGPDEDGGLQVRPELDIKPYLGMLQNFLKSGGFDRVRKYMTEEQQDMAERFLDGREKKGQKGAQKKSPEKKPAAEKGTAKSKAKKKGAERDNGLEYGLQLDVRGDDGIERRLRALEDRLAGIERLLREAHGGRAVPGVADGFDGGVDPHEFGDGDVELFLDLADRDGENRMYRSRRGERDRDRGSSERDRLFLFRRGDREREPAERFLREHAEFDRNFLFGHDADECPFLREHAEFFLQRRDQGHGQGSRRGAREMHDDGQCPFLRLFQRRGGRDGGRDFFEERLPDRRRGGDQFERRAPSPRRDREEGSRRQRRSLQMDVPERLEELRRLGQRFEKLGRNKGVQRLLREIFRDVLDARGDFGDAQGRVGDRLRDFLSTPEGIEAQMDLLEFLSSEEGQALRERLEELLDSEGGQRAREIFEDLLQNRRRDRGERERAPEKKKPEKRRGDRKVAEELELH